MIFNPMAWPSAAKIGGILGVAVLGGVTATAAISSSGTPGEPGVATYLCQASTNDILLQWRSDGSDLSGTYEHVQLSGQAPAEQVSSNSGDLSGTLDGTAITLSIGLSQPLYGTLSGSQLTLNVPQQGGTIQPGTCTQSDITSWNHVVASLNSRAASDNATANQQIAQQQHDQQVSQAQQSLARDVPILAQDAASLDNDGSLAKAVGQMKSDYGTEQSDWQKVQSDSCDSMSYDANTVSYDANTVNYDLNSLNYDVNSLNSGDIQTVQTDLSKVNTDLSRLQNLGPSPNTDSSAALAAGNKALTNSANAISWADGQGSTINSEAQQLSTTASNYATAHCG
jgi:hypothetical protein